MLSIIKVMDHSIKIVVIPVLVMRDAYEGTVEIGFLYGKRECKQNIIKTRESNLGLSIVSFRKDQKTNGLCRFCWRKEWIEWDV